MWYLENFAFLMWDFNDLWSLTGRIYKKTAKHVCKKKKWINFVICPLFELDLHIILALPSKSSMWVIAIFCYICVSD